jgi:hypothetical protein
MPFTVPSSTTVMKNDWHTSVVPNVANKVGIQVPYSVNVQFQDGSIIQARSYFTGKAADGSTYSARGGCCVFAGSVSTRLIRDTARSETREALFQTKRPAPFPAGLSCWNCKSFRKPGLLPQALAISRLFQAGTATGPVAPPFRG